MFLSSLWTGGVTPRLTTNSRSRAPIRDAVVAIPGCAEAERAEQDPAPRQWHSVTQTELVSTKWEISRAVAGQLAEWARIAG